jgi:hypothetical protein
MIVVVLSSDGGRPFVPEVPPGTVVDAVPPGAEVVAGADVDPGPAVPAVLGGAVVLAVDGTVPAGIDELPGALDVALPGVLELPGACAEAGKGVAAASAAQQIPTVRRRRRIRRHRLTETRPCAPTGPLTAGRR